MKYFAIAFLIWNLITFVLMGVDKRRAENGKWRIPERTLLLCALLLGAPGAILGALVFRHKTRKWKFRLALPFMLILNVLMVALILSSIVSASVMGDVVCKVKDTPELSGISTEDARACFSQKSLDELSSGDYQCAMVLGCSVKPDGSPSLMLKDRLDTGILLYKAGVVDRLLLTGDNGQEEYNEVAAMYSYCLEQGVPAEALFLDHAGFSTYESVYRARSIFQVERMIVVTQKYHIYRALYIADGLGIDAVGVCSQQHSYGDGLYRESREVVARIKDAFQTALDLPPTYGGEAIPITGPAAPSQV